MLATSQHPCGHQEAQATVQAWIRDQLRDEIVAATRVRVDGADSPSGVPIHAVADADVSAMSIYPHFADKQALCQGPLTSARRRS